MRARQLTIQSRLASITMLLFGTSCTPHHHGQRLVIDIPPAVKAPANDRQLLRQLDLNDAVEPAAPPRTAIAASAPPPPFRLSDAADENTERAQQCLTAAVYYEARSEPLDGQRAVAQVVLNRVRDRAFPNSICKVVYQRPAHGTGCQFSFACDGSMGKPIEQRAWAVAHEVARAELAGSVFAPIGSATFYHTRAVQPWWAPSLTRIGLVGSHIFYRWGDSLGRALSFRQAYSGHEEFTMPFTPTAALADARSFKAATDGSREMEQGVVVHRASLGASSRPAVLHASFGVMVHYGTGMQAVVAQAPAMDGDPASATPAP